VARFCEHVSIKKAGWCLTSWVTNDFPKNILHHGVMQLFRLNTTLATHSCTLRVTACSIFVDETRMELYVVSKNNETALLYA
jgi:hypothetical protein